MKKLILQQPGRIASSSGSVPDVPVSGVLNQDMEWLKQHYVRCSDLIYRHITIGGHQHRQAAVFYFDGMTDSSVVHDNILQPLLLDAEIAENDAETEENFRNFFEYLKERLLPAGEITVADDLKQGAQAMMNGDVLLIIDGCRQAIVIDAKGFPQRPVGKAENEVVLRGPQEALPRLGG